jgi:hypothetical protein
MSDKEQLIIMLVQTFTGWEWLLDGLTEEQITAKPRFYDMSIKDVIAHLRAWQQVSIARVEAALENREPKFPDWLEGLHPESEEHREEYNARIYELYHDQPWSKVYQVWRDGFRRFLELAEQVPEQDLLNAQKYPWLEGYALSAVLEGSYGHHQEHLEPFAESRRNEKPPWTNVFSLNYFFQQSPQTVKNQIDEWINQGGTATEEIHWLNFAERADGNFRYLDNPCQDGILWSEISLTAYEQALKVDESSGRRNSYENSMMLLRAHMITHCGIVPGHRVLDPQIIQRWFFERLPMTRLEATEKALHWRNLPLTEIQLLRDIKHRLWVIQRLLEHGILTDDTELQEWARIRDDLP